MKLPLQGRKKNPKKQNLASKLRKMMTPSEKRLWQHLRGNRLGGLHFRRQHVLRGFIADFYCYQAKLIIEIDGSVHESQKDYDHFRTESINELGIEIIRFTNQQLEDELKRVLREIETTCQSRIKALKSKPLP